MKTVKFLKQSILSLGLSVPCQAFAIGGGGVIENGGDSIAVGDATRVFDEVEFDEAFLPTAQGEAWDLVDKSLTILTSKLPATGNYLRSIFKPSTSMWWMVNVKLKDIHDEGPTNVIITYEKEQVAANNRGVIQIRKDLWQKMNKESQAVLMMHEALWTAIGSEYVNDGRAIRQISTLLLRQPIGAMTPEELAQWLVQFAGVDAYNSTFYHVIDFDKAALNPGNTSSFSVQAFEGVRRELVATVVAQSSSLYHMKITTLTPADSDTFYYRKKGHPFKYWQWKSGSETTLFVRALCSALTYGGEPGWRLPTQEELYELHRLGVMEFRSAHVVNAGTGWNSLRFWYNIFGDIRLVTQETILLNMSQGARQVPDELSGTEYFEYVCVKP